MKMSPEEVKRQIQGEDSGVESPDLDQSISTDNEGSQAEDVKPPGTVNLDTFFAPLSSSQKLLPHEIKTHMPL